MSARNRKPMRVHGRNACASIGRSRPDDIEKIFIEEHQLDFFRDLLRERAKRKRPYQVVGREDLERITGGVHHEGVCFYVRQPEPIGWSQWFSQARKQRPLRVLFLDGVRNPHNLGAILRTAAHFSVAAVLVDARAPHLGPAATRIAEGGAEHVPLIHLDDPLRALAELRDSGVRLVGADAHARGAEPLFDAALPNALALALGSERHGLSEGVQELIQQRVFIPGSGRVESLNVATAAAVMLAEHARRHP